MIDINLLRENPDLFRDSQRARCADETLVDKILEADSDRRASIAEFESLRAEQKTFGKKVAQAGGEEKEQLLLEVKDLAQRVSLAKAAAEKAQSRQDELLLTIENLIISGIPAGGEDDYALVKTVGQPRDFSAEGFEPRDHLEIGELVAGIDMARGAKVSGSRFYFFERPCGSLGAGSADAGSGSSLSRGFYHAHHSYPGASRNDEWYRF